MEIVIPEQRVPVRAEADVLVCGGGCAGITTAVSAARHGAKVVLLERWPTIGGMATNGLVNGWHRSDREKMVIYGLVEESAKRAFDGGWIEQDAKYPFAHETHWFDPEGMRIVWQRMLDDAGVRTFCNIFAGSPIQTNGKLEGVTADTKSGRCAFTAPLLVDATGDGDLAAAAGVPFEIGRCSDGMVQGMTLMFSLSGIDTEVALAGGEDRVEKVIALMRDLRDAGEFPQFNEGNGRTLLRWARNHFLWNMLPAAGDPINEEELSRLTAESRETLVAYLDLWRRELPGYENARIEQTGYGLGVRESRRISGATTLDAEMVLQAKKQPDAIGHGIWMVDIHDPKGSGYTTFTDRGTNNMLRTGESYHIPYEMCINRAHRNLAVAGRCASSTHEGHSSVRVQTHCMVMGQGVGTAAAIASKNSTDFHDVDYGKLQRVLRDDGVYLEDVPK
jgi:hypothetical protein